MTQREADAVRVHIGPDMHSGKVLVHFDNPTEALLLSSDDALEMAQVLVAAAVFVRHVNESVEATVKECECQTIN